MDFKGDGVSKREWGLNGLKVIMREVEDSEVNEIYISLTNT